MGDSLIGMHTDTTTDGLWMICPKCRWVYSLVGKAITSTSGGVTAEILMRFREKGEIIVDSIPHPSIPLANRHHVCEQHPAKTCKRVVTREASLEKDGRVSMVGKRCGVELIEHPDQDACRAAFRIGGIDAVGDMLEELLRRSK